MRMCEAHWAELRKAIADRAIDHLTAKTTEAAFADMIAQAQGQETAYDPLMAAYWMITGRAIEIGGIYLLGTKDDGSQYCPVCEALEHKPEDLTAEWITNYWINGPADAVLAECRRLGLAAPPQ